MNSIKGQFEWKWNGAQDQLISLYETYKGADFANHSNDISAT